MERLVVPSRGSNVSSASKANGVQLKGAQVSLGLRFALGDDVAEPHSDLSNQLASFPIFSRRSRPFG